IAASSPTMATLPPEQRTLRAALDQRGLAEPLLSSYRSDGHHEARGDGPLRRAAGAVCAAGRELWTFSRNDPRKPVYAAKVATALALITLLVFLREPSDIVSHSVWAILTVVVVFEFSIGATLSKGLNRGLGTLTAGGLALAVAESARHMGDQDIVFLIITTFAVGFATTLIKVHPQMKLYEYGLRVFLLTFCYVTVSGYNTGEFVGGTAVSRFLLIVIGGAVSLAVNIGIYPIWAGEDLHHLVARNFARVAESLEGCVDGYLTCMEYQRVPSKILTYQASDDPLYSGYRAAVEAQTQEETLLGFAIWEPPHGPYKMMKYPWQSYTKVGGALRHCSFAVMALHGCILSEIQSAPENRQVFSAELHRVGDEAAKVLRELGHRVKTMTRLSSPNILSEVLHAAEELQKKIDQRSYLLVNTDRWGASASLHCRSRSRPRPSPGPRPSAACTSRSRTRRSPGSTRRRRGRPCRWRTAWRSSPRGPGTTGCRRSTRASRSRPRSRGRTRARARCRWAPSRRSSSSSWRGSGTSSTPSRSSATRPASRIPWSSHPC
uniref:Aluminum-activated malate transporter n=1 Tax=Aegilops tauschii subsp. strangulata TaxID=200361 RepID=A0A453PH93_AEGTS